MSVLILYCATSMFGDTINSLSPKCQFSSSKILSKFLNFVKNCEFRFLFVQNAKFRDFVSFFYPKRISCIPTNHLLTQVAVVSHPLDEKATKLLHGTHSSATRGSWTTTTGKTAQCAFA